MTRWCFKVINFIIQFVHCLLRILNFFYLSSFTVSRLMSAMSFCQCSKLLPFSNLATKFIRVSVEIFLESCHNKPNFILINKTNSRRYLKHLLCAILVFAKNYKYGISIATIIQQNCYKHSLTHSFLLTCNRSR